MNSMKSCITSIYLLEYREALWTQDYDTLIREKQYNVCQNDATLAHRLIEMQALNDILEPQALTFE